MYYSFPIIPLVSFFLCASFQSVNSALVESNRFDVRKYGALGDGKQLDSPAINKAIDAASAAGGGTVYLSSGTYLSGSIRLKQAFRTSRDRIIFYL